MKSQHIALFGRTGTLLTTRVSIVGTDGIPARYGGFETLAQNLVTYAVPEVAYTVYCSSKGRECLPRRLHGARLRYLPIAANGLQSVVYDSVSMLLSTGQDCVLVLGVSGAWIIPVLRLFFRTRFVVNIDGIEWQRAKWGRLARAFLRCSERIAVRSSDFVIADNAEVVRYVSRTYHRRPVLIEYGGDHALDSAKNEEGEIHSTDSPYAVAVCRIEPENNLHVILDAFSRSIAMKLMAVGNWDANAYGKELRQRYQANPNITMLDPIYNQVRLNQVRRNAKLYVHGHSAGGTNPSLVEAMTLGLPILAFDVPYNRETTENGCDYFSTADELLAKVGQLDGERACIMGQRMKEIAARRYTWRRIAAKYESLYRGRRRVRHG